MAEGSRFASLEDDDILKIIDDKDEVYKSANTILYQFMKYWKKKKRDCFEEFVYNGMILSPSNSL